MMESYFAFKTLELYFAFLKFLYLSHIFVHGGKLHDPIIYWKHYSEARIEDKLDQDEMPSRELDDDEGNNPGKIQRKWRW